MFKTSFSKEAGQINFSVSDLLHGVHEFEHSTEVLGPKKNRQGFAFYGLSSVLSPCSAHPLLYLNILSKLICRVPSF